ncbi:MAG: hypothetical protein AAF228_10885 [Pseudomonadota bacterium]
MSGLTGDNELAFMREILDKSVYQPSEPIYDNGDGTATYDISGLNISVFSVFSDNGDLLLEVQNPGKFIVSPLVENMLIANGIPLG